jgi:hypothetical protein
MLFLIRLQVLSKKNNVLLNDNASVHKARVIDQWKMKLKWLKNELKVLKVCQDEFRFVINH